MGYNQKAQKKYNDKCKRYTIKYMPEEMDIVQAISDTVAKNGKTVNSWMKEAIQEKLERETDQTSDQNEN